MSNSSIPTILPQMASTIPWLQHVAHSDEEGLNSEIHRIKLSIMGQQHEPSPEKEKPISSVLTTADEELAFPDAEDGSSDNDSETYIQELDNHVKRLADIKTQLHEVNSKVWKLALEKIKLEHYIKNH